jgi:type VI secretion system protein ImpC
MADAITLQSMLTSAAVDPVTAPRPMIVKKGTADIAVNEEVSDAERFVSAMAALLYNLDANDPKFDKQTIQGLIAAIDDMVQDQLNEILHTKEFREMEATWTSIADLVDNTNFRANIDLNLLDVRKDEAQEDLELNVADIAGSELFKKVYVAEFDQFGGNPYGAIIGLYEFSKTSDDITWLRAMGKIAAASHAPFVAAASPKLFEVDTMAQVAQLRDIEGIFSKPSYSKWNKLRESDEAVYIGLAMPRYMARAPYNNASNPAEGIQFEEELRGDDDSKYVWGNSAMLFARNLVKSFENSGWCQYIRGVRAGGLVSGLSTYTYNLRGEDELRAPVEISMPDFRELELANVGVIPLIHKKGSADAVFFSAQSIKKSYKFKDPKDSENSQLVTNLSYTFSVSRIAHYVKCIMRDNIGSTADANYIRQQIDRWIARYVTTLVNPDDLTLMYYPFRAYTLSVTPIDGKIGWYYCNLAILPHIQFEGLNVDLRVDARLGGGGGK